MDLAYNSYSINNSIYMILLLLYILNIKTF